MMGPAEIIKEVFGWMAEPPYSTILFGALLLILDISIVYAFVKDYVRRRGYELKIGHKARKENKE